MLRILPDCYVERSNALMSLMTGQEENRDSCFELQRRGQGRKQARLAKHILAVLSVLTNMKPHAQFCWCLQCASGSLHVHVWLLMVCPIISRLQRV